MTTLTNFRNPNNFVKDSYDVTFLLDRKNNWLESYIIESPVFEDSQTFNYSISHDHQSVRGQDIVFILGYTRILGGAFLKKNSLNLVVHESDLPKGKGFSPVQWQILDGSKIIPVCLIEAVNKVDSGDIFCRHQFELTDYELYEEIRMKQAQATVEIINKFLLSYPNYTREKQLGEPKYYPRRTAKDGELHLDRTIRQQFNLLRIGSNDGWPSFFVLDGRKYIVKIYGDDN